MLALGYCEHMGGIKQWSEPQDYLDSLLIRRYHPKTKTGGRPACSRGVSTGRETRTILYHTHTHTHRPCLTVWQTPCFLRGFQLPDHRWQLAVHPREYQYTIHPKIPPKIPRPIQFLESMYVAKILRGWINEREVGWITSYCILYKYCRALTGFRMDEVWQWYWHIVSRQSSNFFWSVQKCNYNRTLHILQHDGHKECSDNASVSTS